jgi:predicted Zn-dependent protease
MPSGARSWVSGPERRGLADSPKGARDSLKPAVRHNPDDAASLCSLRALFLEENKDTRMALSLPRRSVGLDSSNSLFRQLLGKPYFEMGMFPEAGRHLKSALGCSRPNPSPELSGTRALLAAALGKEPPDGAARGGGGGDPPS